MGEPSMNLINVTLPDGTTVTDVPEGITKEQLAEKLHESGFNTNWYVKERMKEGIKGIAGLAEVPLSIGSGIVASSLGGLYGILGGGAEGVRKTQEMLTYQPKTEPAKIVNQAISFPFEKASEGWSGIGQAVGGAIGGEKGSDIGEAIGGVIMPSVAAIAGGKQAQIGYKNLSLRKASDASSKQIEKIQENLKDQSYQSKLKAASDLNEMGGVFNPADVNPTRANIGKARLSNVDELYKDLSGKNAPIIVDAIRQDLGIPSESPLNFDALNNVRKQASYASNEIRQLGVMTDSADGVVSSILESLRPNKNILGQSSGARRSNAAIDEALLKIKEGMTGSDLIDSISTLRRDARETLNNSDVKPKERRVAETQKKIADSLEKLIEINITDKSLLARYRAGRELQAKSYAIQDIIDPQTGSVNLSGLTKGNAATERFTGNLEKLRNIAANFPKSVSPIQSEMSGGATTLSRTGTLGSAGSAIGATVGAPVTMGIIGATGETLGLAPWLRRRLMNPENQSSSIPTNSLSSPVKTSLSIAQPGAPLIPPSHQFSTYQGRGLLSLAEDQPIRNTPNHAEGINFPLRQEVLQQPEIFSATQSFLAESIRLRNLIDKAGGMWKQRYRDQLAELEKEFGAGMRQLGVDNAIDALGLKPLYESGVKTKLPIEKTFSGMMKP